MGGQHSDRAAEGARRYICGKSNARRSSLLPLGGAAGGAGRAGTDCCAQMLRLRAAAAVECRPASDEGRRVDCITAGERDDEPAQCQFFSTYAAAPGLPGFRGDARVLASCWWHSITDTLRCHAPLIGGAQQPQTFWTRPVTSCRVATMPPASCAALMMCVATAWCLSPICRRRCQDCDESPLILSAACAAGNRKKGRAESRGNTTQLDSRTYAWSGDLIHSIP